MHAYWLNVLSWSGQGLYEAVLIRVPGPLHAYGLSNPVCLVTTACIWTEQTGCLVNTACIWTYGHRTVAAGKVIHTHAAGKVVHTHAAGRHVLSAAAWMYAAYCLYLLHGCMQCIAFIVLPFDDDGSDWQTLGRHLAAAYADVRCMGCCST